MALVLAALLVPIAAAQEEPAEKSGRWLAGDLHVHTCYSHDSYCPPNDDNTGPDEAYTLGQTVQEQFCAADARGLDFLAITDHNDVRSQTDPGFGACGVLPVRGYEFSLRGHAQMLGTGEVYDKGDQSAAQVNALADRLRAEGGVFQANHPAAGPTDYPDNPNWKYGYDVRPDSMEVWNITTLWQPPAPASSSNDDAIRYWEGWLDRGEHVAATGGSDTHWRSTSGLQGVGQPTTHVYAAANTESAILEGIRRGRTFISAQPPALGGAGVFLEADGDGDGTFESMVGDTVEPGSALRARVEGAPGASLRVVTDGGAEALAVPVTGAVFEHRFSLPPEATWARVEVFQNDLQGERRTACDGVLGAQTTYCRNRLTRLALTSALYFERRIVQGPVEVRIEADRIALSNGLVERTWTRDPFGTASALDLRTGLRAGASPDFRLGFVDGTELTGADFRVDRVSSASVPGGGLALTIELVPRAGPAGRVTRTVTAYPGIAGFSVRTAVQMPGMLSRYVLDELTLPDGAPELHAFRAGYDWRGSDSLDWEPTVSPLGGHHTGDHRMTSSAAAGQDLEGEGEWLSIKSADGPSAFMVLERVDYASSRMAYEGGTARALVDLRHDLAYLGPFESDVHAANPGAPVRYRALSPARPLDLEPVFTGFALDADDQAWQHYRYLESRTSDWEPTVVFNSNGVDQNRISTGAKDDMDLAEVQRQAEVARRLGVETFVLDDGWQAASGDWCPDSPQCPEPRGAYPDRFPDAEFAAVRDAIAPMELGLWMSPMHFNPAADAYERNPQWNCEPLGEGLVAYNRADPDGGSNEAGLGTWNPEATGPEGRLVDHIEGRIRHAIETWGVRYFKFDFMAWLDCAGAGSVTAYDYRESFVRMLDRLIADHPRVTFQIDETNDYRLFPFESVYRGPSWYANGHPKANEALHNLWVLSPYVPAGTIGQAAYGQRNDLPTDYLMAVALASHMTFFTDLTTFTDAQVQTARRWTDLYRANREALAGFAYPLLDDPLPGDTWTGLQPWDADEQRGALLVFRQDAPEERRSVALRGVRGEGSYRLTDLQTGSTFGVFTADELRGGIDVVLPQRLSAAVLLVEPA